MGLDLDLMGGVKEGSPANTSLPALSAIRVSNMDVV